MLCQPTCKINQAVHVIQDVINCGILKKNPLLKNPPKHISVVSFIPKHVWAVRADDSSAAGWPINEIIYCTCWSKFFSNVGIEKPSENAFKIKLCIIIIMQIIICIIIIFDYYSHMLLSILTILLCYIFLITRIPRDFYLMVSIFSPTVFLLQYVQALTRLCFYFYS